MNVAYEGAVIFCRDIAASRRSCEDLLGQEVDIDFGPNIGFKGGLALWQVDHAFQMIHEHAPENTGLLGRQNLELYFEAASTRFSEAGVKFVHPLREQPWGQRAFCVYDPDGHFVEVGKPMPAVVLCLLGKGLSAEAVAEKTGMPVEIVNQTAPG